MEVQLGNPADEIKRLRRCVNDLVSVLALPAIWAGSEPTQIVNTLLDALLGMLNLDLIYVQLKGSRGKAPIENLRVAPTWDSTTAKQEISESLKQWVGNDQQKWTSEERRLIGDTEISIVSLPLGLHGDAGLLVAGSRRKDFPRETERLVLSAAANQAAIGLKEAWLLDEQKRLANELDERVAQRTIELADANEALRAAMDERTRLAAFREEIGIALSQHEALQAILNRCANTMVRHIDAAFARIWTLSSDGRELELQASAGMYTRLDGSYSRIPIGELKIGLIAQERKPHFTNDVQNDTRVSDKDWARREEMISFAGYPLVLEDRLVGVMGMFSRKALTESTLEALSFAASTIAQGIERKRAEEALADLRSELTQVARITGLAGLTASIAHEVNQPLSGVVTNASTCLRMLGAEPPNVDGARETARRALRDGNRASEMITRLRDLFSKKQVTTESLDLNEATREVIALSLSELQRNRVSLQADLDTELPVITGNRVQLQQVILNLLRNASDAMSTVQDRPRDLVIRTERDEGERVRLIVQDVGIGFDTDALGKLFQAFYTTKDDGMGMGLSISRSIIESHQGRLWAMRNDGPGATFCFSLPCGQERAMATSPTHTI
jgi:signal transduction histidine kinase